MFRKSIKYFIVIPAVLIIWSSSPAASVFGSDVFYTLENVNFRSGASTNSESLNLLNRGTMVIVTGRTSDGWSSVSYNGASGFIRSDFLGTLEQSQARGSNGAYQTLENVNLRSGASTDSEAITLIPRGTAVNVTEFDPGGWSRVSHNGSSGFIKSEYLGTQGASPNNYFTLENVNLRSGASTDSEAITLVPKGTAVNVTEYNPSGWSSVSYNGGSGFIRSDFLGGQRQALSGKYYTLENVNLRAGGSTESDIIQLVRFGNEVEVTEYNANGWSRVAYGGQNGFIKTEYLGTKQQALSGHYYTLENVNLRSGANTESEIIQLVRFGNEVEVTEYNDTGWSRVRFNGQTGFMRTEFLGTNRQLDEAKAERNVQTPPAAPSASAPQIAAAPPPPETAPVSASGVELTHWSEAERVMTIGINARILDVYTGISYNVRSFSNGLHADVEPVTQEDTALMKQTYGGVWAWTPRPVWVTINGKTMAASINGMPHGGGVNPNNGMDGQVCLHFKGSRTHNGNESFSRQHQNAVDVAFQMANN